MMMITDLGAIRDRLNRMIGMMDELDLPGARRTLEEKVIEEWTAEDDELLSLLFAAVDFQEACQRYRDAHAARFWARPGPPRATLPTERPEEERRDAGLA